MHEGVATPLLPYGNDESVSSDRRIHDSQLSLLATASWTAVVAQMRRGELGGGDALSERNRTSDELARSFDSRLFFELSTTLMVPVGAPRLALVGVDWRALPPNFPWRLLLQQLCGPIVPQLHAIGVVAFCKLVRLALPSRFPIPAGVDMSQPCDLTVVDFSSGAWR